MELIVLTGPLRLPDQGAQLRQTDARQQIAAVSSYSTVSNRDLESVL